MSEIILIQDLLNTRRRKELELVFYCEKLEELQQKMSYLRQEINLTTKIISIIKKEELVEIKAL